MQMRRYGPKLAAPLGYKKKLNCVAFASNLMTISKQYCDVLLPKEAINFVFLPSHLIHLGRVKYRLDKLYS